jgi:N-acetylglutamate synthase
LPVADLAGLPVMAISIAALEAAAAGGWRGTEEAALAADAAARGVTGIYLQAEDGNAAARALYCRAGFTDHHGYHYRVAPAT